MFSPFCSDLFKYLLGAPWTLLSLLVIGSFTCILCIHVHIVSYAHNSYRVVLYCDICFGNFSELLDLLIDQRAPFCSGLVYFSHLPVKPRK